MDFTKCTIARSCIQISVQENGRIFRLNNPQKKAIAQVKVDGCLISNEYEKCDYLFELNNPPTRIIFVELKGKKIEKACSQLNNTILITNHNYPNIKKDCYIVSSRCPVSAPKIQQLTLEMRKKTGASLRIKTQTLCIEV